MARQPFAYSLAVRFGLPMIVFALLWGVLQNPFNTLEGSVSSHVDSSAGATGLGYMADAWNYAPLWVLFGLAVAIVVSALFRSSSGVLGR